MHLTRSSSGLQTFAFDDLRLRTTDFADQAHTFGEHAGLTAEDHPYMQFLLVVHVPGNPGARGMLVFTWHGCF